MDWGQTSMRRSPGGLGPDRPGSLTLCAMDAEIRPEPSAEEREAILAALARHYERDESDPRGAWWRLGVEESLAGAPPGQDVPTGAPLDRDVPT